jgi:rubrerythrin
MTALEQAITAERKSITIYESLANIISLPDLKSLFISMARDEQYHAGVISFIVENPGISMFYQPDLENLSRIFESIVDGEGLEGLSKEVIEGCHQALKNEETVLSRYEELLANEENKTTKGLLGKIVEQEKKHSAIIKDLCILVSEQQSAK